MKKKPVEKTVTRSIMGLKISGPKKQMEMFSGFFDQAEIALKKSGDSEKILAMYALCPEMKSFLSEWGRQVLADEDPSALATLFMDKSMGNSDEKAAFTYLANLMKTRNWFEMKQVFDGCLESKVVHAFETKYAEEFYPAFRDIVSESIRAAIEQFLKERARRRKGPQRPPEAQIA